MEEKIYNVTMTEAEIKLFSEFLEQREYAAKHYAPKAQRDALAAKAREMRRRVTPAAITADKAKRMKKAGHPKFLIENESRLDNVRPTIGPNKGISTNERLQRAGNERIRQEIARDRELLENRYAPKYTPDKFR